MLREADGEPDVACEDDGAGPLRSRWNAIERPGARARLSSAERRDGYVRRASSSRVSADSIRNAATLIHGYSLGNTLRCVRPRHDTDLAGQSFAGTGAETRHGWLIVHENPANDSTVLPETNRLQLVHPARSQTIAERHEGSVDIGEGVRRARQGIQDPDEGKNAGGSVPRGAPVARHPRRVSELLASSFTW